MTNQTAPLALLIASFDRAVTQHEWKRAARLLVAINERR